MRTVTLAAYPQGHREGLMGHDTAYEGPSTILGTCELSQPPSGFEPHQSSPLVCAGIQSMAECEALASCGLRTRLQMRPRLKPAAQPQPRLDRPSWHKPL